MRTERSHTSAGLAAVLGGSLLGLACLTACSVDEAEVTIGRDFPMERVVAIHKGKTNKRQVEELLGPPYKQEDLGARKTRWRYYSRSEAREHALIFIHTNTYVVEREVIVVFDGAFVESVDQKREQFKE